MSLAQKLNYYKYRFKYLYGNKLNLKVPVDVSLELSSACSMRCVYCYHSKENAKYLPFKRGFMPKDLATKLLLECAELGVHSLKTNYRGESTMNPHFYEITTFAKSLARGSTLIDRITNSNFKFPRKRREKILLGLASQTKVKVSYDSFKKEVFETQRAGGDHDLTTENIELFYNHPERIKSETQLVIQAVRTELNKDEDIYHETKKRWPEAEVSIRDMVSGRNEQDVSDLQHKSRSQERIPCKQAFVRLIINHDGSVSPCCPAWRGDLIIGDAQKSSVKDIFNSYYAKNLRASLKSGEAFEIDPCKTCSSFESYKGYKAPIHS